MDINELCKQSHELALKKGFWDEEKSIPVKLMLIVTELAEACEADRHGDREGFNEEIADTFIRLGDLCGYLELDIEEEINKKHNKNKHRPYRHDKKY